MAERLPEDRLSIGNYVGIGCVTMVAGFFGGGMIAVLLAKVVGSLRECKPPEGIPACDWGSYAMVGMIIGVVGLPLVSIIRLRSRRS